MGEFQLTVYSASSVAVLVNFFRRTKHPLKNNFQANIRSGSPAKVVPVDPVIFMSTVSALFFDRVSNQSLRQMANET